MIAKTEINIAGKSIGPAVKYARLAPSASWRCSGQGGAGILGLDHARRSG
jgi:hypothetical protein